MRPHALLFLALALLASPARADLQEDAARLARFYTEHGARVERVPPLFLERGQSRVLTLTAPREGDTGCVTLAILGVRTTELFVTREERESEPVEVPFPVPLRPEEAAAARTRSAGGAVGFTACGAERARLARVRIEMASARAALEIVAVRSESPPRPLREILPERASGPTAPRGDPGAPLEPRPLAERLARAEKRALAEGAASIERFAARAEALGTGRIAREIPPGCHRLELLADAPSTRPARHTDVDAEVHDAGGRVLARDVAELPDARLDFCVGEITQVSVSFAGAPGAVPVTLQHARFRLPVHLPARWGARARAGVASALRARRAPEPVEPALHEALGAQGATMLPLAVVPGRCYLAAAALARGEARLLRLSATLGDRVRRDDTLDRDGGVAVTFCAGPAETHVRLDLEARAPAAVWALGVWPMGAVAP